MLLSFTLSMPNNNAWDGKWSGEGNLYAQVINFGQSKKGISQAAKILNGGYYRYDFGDGWAAGITVRRVAQGDAAKIRRKSKGFYGYDWMIDSIRETGSIVPPSERANREG